MKLILLALLPFVARAADDGLALLPPMGWRSWNAFHNDISDAVIRKQADGLADLSRSVDGAPTSLASLGYVDLGIDEGWEGCGEGFNHTQHTQYGWPVVDATKFSQMNETVAYVHGKGLRAGWYFNGCACGEPVEQLINYEGDVAENFATRFDSVKLDSCGAQKNLSLYYDLFNGTGKQTMIENCHQGGDPPRGDGYCPYHLFRVSGDIINLFDRVLSNLQHARPFLGVDPQLNKPLSRPGCWAYPDMLEVGRMPGETGFDGVTVLATPAAESRTHFGAWAIISAPLVLGLSLSLDDPVAQKALDGVWDVITNREVIAVSQSWAGLPGALVREWQAPNVPTLVSVMCPAPPRPGRPAAAPAHTWAFIGSALSAGDDILSAPYNLSGAEAFCASRDDCVGFTFKGAAQPDPAGETVYFKSALNINQDTTWSAYAKDYSPPAANVSHWTLDAASGLLRQGDGGVCLDSAGQLPETDAPNWLRMRGCNASVGSQVWHMTAAGQVVSNATGQCLGNNAHWLWDWRSQLALTGCNAADPQQLWTLRAADGALVLPAANVCAGSSDRSGPASQVWRKPVAADGSTAVLVINGALFAQTVNVSLADLGMNSSTASARDLFAHADLPNVAGAFSVVVAPHDSAMLMLKPQD